jgi:hypothetical protein
VAMYAQSGAIETLAVNLKDQCRAVALTAHLWET